MKRKGLFVKIEKLFIVMIGVYLVNALVFTTFLTTKNLENQSLIAKISSSSTENETLTAKIGQMKSYQTIYEVAKANGWQSNQDNVKTID